MLVAIEGIDASGKNTQAHLLKEKLESAGRTAAILSFPRYGETLYARSVADYLNGRFGELHAVSPYFAALLYAGDRLESRRTLVQLAQSHDVLIFDRYVASNIAYQAARLDAEHREPFIAWLAQIEYGINEMPPADLTFFLDVPVETAIQLLMRKKQRSYTTERTDLHERDTELLRRCREMYLTLAGANLRSRWLTVECTLPDGQMRPAADITESMLQPVLDCLRDAAGVKAGSAPSGAPS